MSRKVRRLTNEFQSIADERFKRPRAKAWPVSINLNHTTICNLRCIMCQQALEDVPQRVMEREVYHRIRDEFFERSSELSLTVMGDPFCVPKPFFNEILDDVERYGLRLEITTNATLFGSGEELERLVRLTRKLTISMDGATKDTFEKIRVPAKWDKTVEKIERFCEVRRKLPPWRRPVVHFNYVLMQSNVQEFPLFVELAAGWGASAVTGSPLVEVHPDIAHEVIDPQAPRERAIFQEAAERALEHGVGLTIAGHGIEQPKARGRSMLHRLSRRPAQWLVPWKPVRSGGINYLAQKALHRFAPAKRECGFLWNKAYIQIDGRIGTCCHPGYYVTGDVMERPLSEVWNSKRYQGLRSSLNTAYPAKACKDCHLLRT